MEQSPVDGVNNSCDDLANVMEVEQEAIAVDESFVMAPPGDEAVGGPTPFKAKSLNVMFEDVAETEKEVMPPPVPAAAAAAKPNHNRTNSIEVCLRVRPMADTSKQSTIKILPSSTVPVTVRTIPPPGSFSEKQRTSSEGISGESEGSELQTLKEFTYSHVFAPETEQSALYESTASSLVTGMFDPVKPQSALLFAYGITNAGKSHTIMGSDKEPGIVPRTMKDIFSKMNPKLELHMSYLEIYNEQVYDLLATSPAPSKKGRVAPRRQGLKLQDNKGTIEVRGLSKHKVRDTDEGLKLAATAKKNRQVTGTNLNGVSSRSHSVCQLELVPTKGKSGKNAMFWIVDLAGSERSKRTGVGAKSTQQREASGINTSLMKLWRCLKQLRSNQQAKATALASNQAVPKAPLVPFRESKLTHLFMNHLSGASAGRTVMIVNVNPQPDDYDETQHVLNSAAIAQSVRITNEEYVKKKEKHESMVTHDANGRNLKRIAEDEAAKEKEGIKRNCMRRPSVNASNAAMNSKMQQMANENDALRSALNSLKERLFNAETEIREEVAEEFEERISEIHEEYAMQKRNQEASMGVPTPARSVRKLQAEKANDYVDELLDKIVECEEEMERMRDAHGEEVDENESVVVGLRNEITRLKGESVEEEIGAEEESVVTEGAVLTSVGINSDGTVKYDAPVTSKEVDGGNENGEEMEEGENEEGENEEGEEEEEEEEEGEESDGSIMDLIDEDKSGSSSSVNDAVTVGAVVAESADTPRGEKESEEEIKLVEPNDEERKKMDEEAQKRKLRRLPRNRCSEVACIPVKKEKAVSPVPEASGVASSLPPMAKATPELKKKKGLFAKLTSCKKKDKRKASEDISPSGNTKRDRKSLGEISNISELTQPTVAGGKSKKPVPRPRGRAPRGKIWDPLYGSWVVKA